ncbi:hypothetical protein ID247_001328 [Escherichia coli]|nr:hypothetical protein [Escherichia coli]EEW0824800.1 hypothetical protein [Escherichia coli]EEW3527915.1 hypothetical protein [Escherichia coli]EFH9817295.1 hypothetical protein [Escherichia coli]EFK8111904.1 hypothetical protein [Escherichia coli]
MRITTVFPAPAGINLDLWDYQRGQISVPRASGDKPFSGFTHSFTVSCSPRQRG